MQRNSSRSRQRGYMLDGRLVYDGESPMDRFSWLRFGVMASILCFLYVTNPANQNHNLFSALTWRDGESATAALTNAYEKRRTTNFGLFSVKERTVKAVVCVAGVELDCPYDEPTAGSVLCQDILRDHLTHQKPLFFSSRDRVYTTHRFAAWLLLASALISFSFTKPLVIKTGYLLLDSLACFFFDTRSSPLWSVAIKLLQLNILVYPALQAMNTTVQQQSRESFFATLKSADANFGLSVAVLVWIAVIMNAASKSWTGSFLLQFEALTAVGMGYYALYQTSGMVSFDTMGDDEDISAWNIITWTLIFLAAVRGSVPTAVFWYLAYCAGQLLFNYHYEHLVVVATARLLSDWFDSASRTMEQVLGYLFGPTVDQRRNRGWWR